MSEQCQLCHSSDERMIAVPLNQHELKESSLENCVKVGTSCSLYLSHCFVQNFTTLPGTAYRRGFHSLFLIAGNEMLSSVFLHHSGGAKHRQFGFGSKHDTRGSQKRSRSPQQQDTCKTGILNLGNEGLGRCFFALCGIKTTCR